MFDSTDSSYRGAPGFAAALLGSLLASLLGFSADAQAGDLLCKPEQDTEIGAHADSLREKASRFAPELAVRLWLEPHADEQLRARGQSQALSPAPAPPPSPDSTLQRTAKARKPFGWQVSFQWDLVEIAQAVHPGLLEPTSALAPSSCLDAEDLATRLLLEESADDIETIETTDTE